MENKSDYSEDIRTIKRIMEESSRFLSLSGLSGIFAGFVAVLGGAVAHFGILKNKTLFIDSSFISLLVKHSSSYKIQLFADALIVLFLALGGSFYFSYRTARQKGVNIWTPVSRRLLLNLFTPLISGAFFILILYTRNEWQLIVPAMLTFYALALLGAGKFTYNEVSYLGLAELITGFTSAIFQGLPILFWVFGFGVLHIAYGFFMYRKYER